MFGIRGKSTRPATLSTSGASRLRCSPTAPLRRIRPEIAAFSAPHRRRDRKSRGPSDRLFYTGRIAIRPGGDDVPSDASEVSSDCLGLAGAAARVTDPAQPGGRAVSRLRPRLARSRTGGHHDHLAGVHSGQCPATHGDSDRDGHGTPHQPSGEPRSGAILRHLTHSREPGCRPAQQSGGRYAEDRGSPAASRT